MDNELLDLLAYELGEIHRWEEECPGVYYLAAIPDADNPEEYYIVLSRAVSHPLGPHPPAPPIGQRRVLD
jgi:hypothetical protein